MKSLIVRSASFLFRPLHALHDHLLRLRRVGPLLCYCGSMPASLIEAVHFTSSDLTKASKSWGPLQ
jgi:hypothetical protein